MVIRVGVMSDLHVEYDEDLISRAQAQASRGLTDSVQIRWWRHITEREPTVGHPRLGPDLWAIQGVDLIFMAGDIWSGVRSVEYAGEVADYCGCPVALVAGNHDFYGADMAVAVPAMAAAAEATGGRVRFLDDTRTDFILDGRRLAVLGSVLWTDFCLHGAERQAEAMKSARWSLNDHLRIAIDGRHFMPLNALQLHERSRVWLADAVPRARAEAEIVIVAVHHGVVPEANAEEYRGDVLAPAFASDLTADILRWGADLVVSGHTHHPLDMTVGKTRIVSAPRGYIGSEPGSDSYVPQIVELA